MKKEEWIEEVFNSTQGIKRANASPFLLEKIAQRIASENEQKISKLNPAFKWAFTLTAILFISVNIVSIKKISSLNDSKNMSEQINEFNHSVIYNY